MLSFELQAHLNKHSTRMSDLGFVSGLEDLKKKLRSHLPPLRYVFYAGSFRIHRLSSLARI